MGNKHSNKPEPQPAVTLSWGPSNEDYPLHSACLIGDLEKVRSVYSGPDDLTKLDCEYRSPLKCAILARSLDVVKFLVEKGADINASDDISPAPFHLACELGVVEIIEFLIASGAVVNPEIKDSDGNMPIHIACALEDRNQRFEVVKLLLHHGVDPNAKGPKDKCPIHWACESGDLQLVKLLVEYKTDLLAVTDDSVSFGLGHHSIRATVNAKTPVSLALLNGHKDVLSYFIEMGLDVSDRKVCPQDCFVAACMSGKPDFIEYIVNAVYKDNVPDDSKINAVHIIASTGSPDVLKFLINISIEVDTPNLFQETPLHSAILAGNESNAHYLIQTGADIEAKRFDKKTAMHLCSETENCASVLEVLISKNGKINAFDIHKRTPLHYATLFGMFDVMDVLLKHGADPSLTDEDGANPLHLMCTKMLYEPSWDRLKLQEFLALGVDVNARDTKQKTAMHNAATKGYLGYLKALVACGGDVTAIDGDGQTLLHSAASWHDVNRKRIAEYLIDHGLVVDSLDKNGCTSLHIAARAKEIGLLDLLVSKGANIHCTNNDVCTPLHFLLTATDSFVPYTSQPADILKWFLDNGANVNIADAEGRTPLHCACENTSTEVVKMLISNGADKSAVDTKGRNVLHYAAASQNESMVEFIFNESLNKPDQDGRFPIHSAKTTSTFDFLSDRTEFVDKEALNHYVSEAIFTVDVMKKLSEKGANFNTPNKDGNTLLHRTLEIESEEEVKYLLDHGADVNATNKDLLTPLHFAARTFSVNIAKLLVQHGANLRATDKDGRTPLQYGMFNLYRCEEVLKYLMSLEKSN